MKAQILKAAVLVFISLGVITGAAAMLWLRTIHPTLPYAAMVVIGVASIASIVTLARNEHRDPLRGLAKERAKYQAKHPQKAEETAPTS